MTKVLSCLKNKWYLFLIVMGAIIAQCYLQLMLPEYMGKITQLIMSDSPSKINDIWINGGWMILISVGVVILATIQNFLGATLSAIAGRELIKRSIILIKCNITSLVLLLLLQEPLTILNKLKTIY